MLIQRVFIDRVVVPVQLGAWRLRAWLVLWKTVRFQTLELGPDVPCVLIEQLHGNEDKNSA